MDGDRRAIVVHLEGGKGASVDGIVFPIGDRDFCLAARDRIPDPGGDDKTVRSGVRNDRPVVSCSKRVIQFPSYPWVISTLPL